jgi:hypothetical protein
MQNTMVPLHRQEPSIFYSSSSSLSASDSQRSYFQIEDEAKLVNDNSRTKSSANGKIRKRVIFSEYAVVSLIPNIDHYTREEREAIYLTPEDYVRIRNENQSTIARIQKGELPDTESECFRGLEWRGMSHLYNKKRSMRQITTSLIISEQEQGDEICPDWIENVYCSITEDSVAQAIEFAYRDYQIVLKDIGVAYNTFESKPRVEWVQKINNIRQ